MKTMLKAATTASLMLASPAWAGWDGGMEVWGFQVSGTIEDSGDALDSEDDLGNDAEPSTGFRLRYEPAFDSRWVPNVTLRARPIEVRGDAQVSQDTNFGPVVLQSGSRVVSRVDVDDISIAARWSKPVAGFDVAAGLRVRGLDGEVVVAEEGGDSETNRVDETFPMLSARLRSKAANGFSFGAGGDWISDGDNTVYDWQAGLRWHGLAPIYLGLEYAVQRIEVVDDAEDFRLDTRLDGVRFSFGLTFD